LTVVAFDHTPAIGLGVAWRTAPRSVRQQALALLELVFVDLPAGESLLEDGAFSAVL
jgi:hypothetical protein